MEIREFAERILFANTLEEKLAGPTSPLTDEFPGRAILSPALPGRPANLVPRSRHDQRPKFPRDARLIDETERARLLHFFANHELLAVELMALALLKFPDAPKAFRRGVARTLQEEQDHTRWYKTRMEECGLHFGDLGVSGMIWDHIAPMESPLDYVGRLSLTFEQSNLDYAKHYCEVLAQAGDPVSSALLGNIYRDEIAHVGYGLKWLRRWKEDKESDWEAFRKTLKYPLSPIRAKGVVPFNAEGRLKAGLKEDFIQNLQLFEQSRGRTPAVLWFHPSAEEEWAAHTEGRPYHEPIRAAALAADLEPAFALTAHPDYVALVRRLPSTAHKAYLRSFGIVMPELVPLEDATQHLAGRRLNAATPWAWSPSMAHVFAPLREQLTQPFAKTAAEWFSKATSAELLADLAERGIDTGPLAVIIDQPQPIAEIKQTSATAGWSHMVAKPWFSMAGRGLRFLDCTNPMSSPSDTSTLARVVVEPWLEKVFEFSAHYDVEANDIKFVGFVRQKTDRSGKWLSCATGQKFLKGLAPDLAVFLTQVLPIYEAEIQVQLRRLLGRFPHHGPLGIDAFVWRDATDRLRLRPVVEINPRWTMGRVTLALQKRLAPQRWLRLHTIKPEALADQPKPILTDGRWQSGSLCLTDPTQSAGHLVVLDLSSHPT